MRRALLLALAATAGCSRASCDPAAPAAGVRRTLTLGTTTEPATLDPAFNELSGAQELVRLLFRDLTVLDDRWQLLPELAESLPVAVTSTGQDAVVRWRLREGLRWSDGAPLGPRDVIFGHGIEADPALEAVSHETARQLRSMVATGPREVTAVWRGRFADYRAPRVHAILPAHAYPSPVEGAPFRGLLRAEVGSGPFRLASWVPGQRAVLERNPHWHGPEPALESIVFRFFPSDEAFEAELATGGIDALGEAAGLGLERAEALAERLRETHRVVFTGSGLWLHLDLRLDHPTTGRLEVRQAIHRALDRAALAKLVYAGHARPAGGLFPPRHPAFREALAPRPPDLQAARALLESAGLSKEDRRLRLQLAAGSEASERAALLVAARLGELGFSVQLEALPMRNLMAQLKAREQAPLALYAWRVRPDWDGRSALHSGGRQNATGLSDARLDALLDEARGELDPARWAANLHAVEDRFLELLPSIPLVFRDDVSVHPRWLEGWRPTGTVSPVTWNAETWRVAPRAEVDARAPTP
jgi:peptide/nickel transport system substrate-binding protein